MATNIILETFQDLLKEQKAALRVVTGDDSGNPNTRHQKAYKIRREVKYLTIVSGLLGQVPAAKLEALRASDKNFNEALTSIMNPEDGGTKVVVAEGDKLLSLINGKYAGVRDVVARAMAHAEKQGLVLADDQNTFVRR